MTAFANIQSALAEFFAQTSSQERLAQLQQSLISFEQQPSSWMSAIEFLSISSDQYVCMFSLGIIESTIKQRWNHLTSSEKQQIFRFLERYAFSDQDWRSNIPIIYGVRCKAVKIWTSICKRSLPELHDQFFSRITTLLSFPDSLTTESDLQSNLISFSLLKAACEELICQDSEISRAKYLENVSIFNCSVPQILSALFEVTERLLGQELIDSVNSLFIQFNGSTVESPFMNSLRLILYFDANLLFSSSNSKSEKKGLSNLLLQNFANILECLTLILSVSTIGDMNNCRMYSLLYIFLMLGSPHTLSTLLSSSRSRNLSPCIPIESLAEIGMHSISCLTEVVERKDIQRSVMIHHLPFIFRCLYWSMLILDPQFPLYDLSTSIVGLMAESGVALSTSQSANNLSGLASVSQTLESISEEYYQKMVDVLRPLVTVFLLFTRPANMDEQHGSLYSFSSTKFLQRVHFFTFNTCRPIITVYLSILDLWNAYLDFIKSYYANNNSSVRNAQIPPQNQQIISDLCASLLNTIYFSESAEYLDLLDSEYASGYTNCDDDHSTNSYLAFFDDLLQHVDCSDMMAEKESEYRGFMQSSLTLLSNIAHFNPTVVMHSVAAKFQEEMKIFTELCSTLERTKLEEHTTRKLHYSLRDLATCLNSLAYLSDHFASLSDSAMLKWLLQALVFNLNAGVTCCDRLKSLQIETLQQDVIQVVVGNISLLRCLLSGGLLMVSDAVTQNVTDIPQGHIVLSIDDKDAFTTSLLQCSHHLILTSPVSSLQTNAALLFQSIVISSAPPGFFPPANQLSEGSVLADLITCCCEPIRLKSFSIHLQRILMRTVTAYLLIDESATINLAKVNPQRTEELQALTAKKTGVLVNRLMPIFTQTLNVDILNSNRDAYFAGLCWLTEALASLIPLGTKSRRLMYDALTECGVLNAIWKCFEATSLSSEVYLFIAHLSFFVQFADIYGNQRATASMIPGFVTNVMQLLQVLDRNTATARLVSPVISHLLHLLDRLGQNRVAFHSLAPDVLRFISNCLVVNLAGGSISDLPTTVSNASKSDPDLCLRVFKTLFNTFSYEYTQLASNEEHLAAFLRPVLSVFSGKVFDPRLLISCIEFLTDLNTRHRFFTLPIFMTQWRSQFAQQWLELLSDRVNVAVQRGSDAESAIIGILHGVYCTPDGFNSKEFVASALEPFLARVLEKKEQFAAQLMTVLMEKSPKELAVLDEFTSLLSVLLVSVRQNPRVSVAVNGKFGQCEFLDYEQSISKRPVNVLL
ncbi:unnamed protein product [Rodentolepis nana]|uniref:Importin N-terminal domain-containing protein n=1 Tax=Rodentolepis nana TaxID=102285 RepID=A0A0R3TLG7_RODNA|nr:unnamed protein product [Rodentolepis nana]